jgi:hypothetical protein
MPDFNYDGYVDINVDEFLSACDNRDKEELVTALVDDGYIKPSDLIREDKMTVPEQIFEEALSKLHGKWNMLSKDEEEMIMALAKRF